MRFLYKAFRIKEWVSSKLTMQIGFFLLFAFCGGADALFMLKPFALFVAYAVTYFALGYIANDLSDVAVDKKVEKRNAFIDKGIGLGVFLFVLLSLLNIGVALLISRYWLFLLLIVLGYLIGIFYSFKPFRYRLCVLFGDYPLRAEHGRVSDRPFDVLSEHTGVNVY